MKFWPDLNGFSNCHEIPKLQWLKIYPSPSKCHWLFVPSKLPYMYYRSQNVARTKLRGCLYGGRENLERETNFRLVFCSSFGRGGRWKSNKTVGRPAAAIFVFFFFVPSTRIFRAKVVYMVLGSS